MIPLIIHLHIVEGKKQKVKLILPLFLLWILLLPFVIVLTPLVLLVSLILWPSGYSKMFLASGSAIFSVLYALSGLHIEVEGEENKILIWMK